MITNNAIVYKNLEKDIRFRNKLEIYLYFRLWGIGNAYKPFIGDAKRVKNFFHLEQPINIIKNSLNYMYRCGLIKVYNSNTFKDQYLICSNYIGERVGEFYLMGPEDTLNNIKQPETYEKFVYRDSNNLLNTRCNKCPHYGIDCCFEKCMFTLMEKIEQYENILGLN